jgi:hypothetical protein
MITNRLVLMSLGSNIINLAFFSIELSGYHGNKKIFWPEPGSVKFGKDFQK